MALPSITIVGNTTGPAELRFTQAGKAVCGFTVVANKRRKTDTGWEDAGRSPFIRVSLWEADAEAAAEVLDEAKKVIVTGTLLAREYEDREGNKRESIELDYATVGVVPTPPKSDRDRARGDHRPADQADPWATPGGSAGDPWASTPATDEPPF